MMSKNIFLDQCFNHQLDSLVGLDVFQASFCWVQTAFLLLPPRWPKCPAAKATDQPTDGQGGSAGHVEKETILGGSSKSVP